MGNYQAVERSLQRKLVWMGLRVQRHCETDARYRAQKKLKELGIKWATLDGITGSILTATGTRAMRHFHGDSIKQMVDDFHQAGNSRAPALGGFRWGSNDEKEGGSRTSTSCQKVTRELPDWFILDKNGKHARMTRDLARRSIRRCPKCEAYFKQLTEKFIRDWGFDGSARQYL